MEICKISFYENKVFYSNNYVLYLCCLYLFKFISFLVNYNYNTTSIFQTFHRLMSFHISMAKPSIHGWYKHNWQSLDFIGQNFILQYHKVITRIQILNSVNKPIYIVVFIIMIPRLMPCSMPYMWTHIHHQESV